MPGQKLILKATIVISMRPNPDLKLNFQIKVYTKHPIKATNYAYGSRKNIRLAVYMS